VHAVQEYLRSLPHLVKEVYLLPSLQGSVIDQLAHQGRVLVRYKPRGFFAAFCAGGVHQGVAARLRPMSFPSLQEILKKEADVLLVLDGIVDPRNFGALLRTAEAVNVGGVIIPQRRAAPLSPVVEKTAAGATAYVSLCRVANLARSLENIRQAGYWLIGLAPEAGQTLYELPLPPKVALVLGGEEKGLRYLTRQKCDILAALPMRGRLKSLNVSVAGAVALYELLRRKTGQGRNH
jgi:23S rRNA (guanosine2251-2'-O)-methyltransferase